MRPSLVAINNPYVYYVGIFTSLIIIFACFIIYYRTREIYDLTEHRGIKYFRRGFLFFGISQVIFFIINLFVLNNLFVELFPRRMFLFGLVDLINFIGIAYLFSSLFSNKIREYHIYLITISVFLISFLFRERFLIMLYSFILILSFGIVSIIKLKEKNKRYFSQIYVIYVLIFISWIVTLIGRVLTKLYDIGRYYLDIFSAIFFLYILYRVIKKLEIKK